MYQYLIPVIVRKPFLIKLKRNSLTFSTCMVLIFIFRSPVHSKFIFVYGVKHEPNFIFKQNCSFLIILYIQMFNFVPGDLIILIQYTTRCINEAPFIINSSSVSAAIVILILEITIVLI